MSANNRAENVSIQEQWRIFEQAVAKWGKHSQIKMAIEELSELITELCKIDRLVNGTTPEKVAEEIADARLMIDQVEYMLEIASDVAELRQKKLKRLRELLE